MYSVLAYYFIGEIQDPLLEMERHKEFFKDRDFRGRIYISTHGINGQSSGREEDAQEYMDWLRGDPRFQEVRFKIHKSEIHAYPKMTVKVRKQLVAVDYEVDFSKRGERVTPRDWKERLEKMDEDTILIDTRNRYEWEVGHFEKSELPDLKSFREFPAYAKKLKETRDPKKTKVMMCCTGGIRCEYFSAIMKQEGFEFVSHLDGGIIGYGLEQGGEHWRGKLFVFDDRMVIPLSPENSEPIAECSLCACSCDVYHNCANMDCNKLFISCLPCLKEQDGCCSALCQETGRVRPFKENAIPFRKIPHCEKRNIQQRKRGIS